MLKSSGKPGLLLKLGTWVCVCMRQSQLNARMKRHIRPRLFGGLACWCDRSEAE